MLGTHGRTAAATLVERTTRFTTILALPAGKDSQHLTDALIDNADELRQVDQDNASPREPLVTYSGTLALSRANLTCLANLLRAYRARTRSRWPRLDPRSPCAAGIGLTSVTVTSTHA